MESDFLKMINNPSKIETIKTDKLILVKSKYKIINFIRKIFHYEKFDTEYLYKWNIK